MLDAERVVAGLLVEAQVPVAELGRRLLAAGRAEVDQVEGVVARIDVRPRLGDVAGEVERHRLPGARLDGHVDGPDQPVAADRPGRDVRTQPVEQGDDAVRAVAGGRMAGEPERHLAPPVGAGGRGQHVDRDRAAGDPRAVVLARVRQGVGPVADRGPPGAGTGHVHAQRLLAGRGVLRADGVGQEVAAAVAGCRPGGGFGGKAPAAAHHDLVGVEGEARAEEQPVTAPVVLAEPRDVEARGGRLGQLRPHAAGPLRGGGVQVHPEDVGVQARPVRRPRAPGDGAGAAGGAGGETGAQPRETGQRDHALEQPAAAEPRRAEGGGLGRGMHVAVLAAVVTHERPSPKGRSGRPPATCCSQRSGNWLWGVPRPGGSRPAASRPGKCSAIMIA